MNRQQILKSPAFQEFLNSVQQKLSKSIPDATTLKPSLEAERAQLEQQCQGWRFSLSKSSLAVTVRCALETDLEQAMNRIATIDTRLAEWESSTAQCQEAVDAETVASRLEHLGEILSEDNASATNLILSQHIAEIVCDAEGKVIVRLCLLGALGNPAHLLPKENTPGLLTDEDSLSPRRRRRTKRNVGSCFEGDGEDVETANDFAVDPDRFAGLGPDWFTEDVFQVPRRLSWAEEHALEVATYRLKTSATMQKTCQKFEKTIPTIREALRYARDTHGVDAYGKNVSISTRAFWPRDHADEVATYFQRPGATMKEAAAHFGKSQPWISKARKLAREKATGIEEESVVPPGPPQPPAAPHEDSEAPPDISHNVS